MTREELVVWVSTPIPNDGNVAVTGYSGFSHYVVLHNKWFYEFEHFLLQDDLMDNPKCIYT